MTRPLTSYPCLPFPCSPKVLGKQLNSEITGKMVLCLPIELWVFCQGSAMTKKCKNIPLNPFFFPSCALKSGKDVKKTSVTFLHDFHILFMFINSQQLFVVLKLLLTAGAYHVLFWFDVTWINDSLKYCMGHSSCLLCF